MAIVVELTYDMSKALGVRRLELEHATSMHDVLQDVRRRFEESNADFDALSKLASVAVNGVLTRYREAERERIRDGDRITFVKAAAGG